VGGMELALAELVETKLMRRGQREEGGYSQHFICTSAIVYQALKRAVHLPKGMEQLLVIDIRGQTVTFEQRAAIREAIAKNSKGAIKPESIQFKE